MLTSILPRLRNCTHFARVYSTVVSNKDDNIVLEPRQLQFPPKYQKPRQVWLENLDTIDEKKLGLLDLHPDIFAANPRVDIIHQNVRWQQLYRFVSFAHTKVRSEVRGGGRKPWPQK
ncbi:hypothetical protein ILUMI_15358, partial [Ignelater luminosus]